MTNDQKIEIVKKALELGGADITINFFDNSQEEAKTKLNALKHLIDGRHTTHHNEQKGWYGNRNDEFQIEVAAFYES